MNHSFFMEKALAEAKQALENGEFPVGCVIVHNHRIVATGSRLGTSPGSILSETDHAEILALKKLELAVPVNCRNQITLYCTLEPCLMCLGAILISGIRNIVYAYEDVMGGGTSCDLSKLPCLYSSQPVSIVSNVLREKSIFLFKSFFSNPQNTYWKGSLLAGYTLGSTWFQAP